MKKIIYMVMLIGFILFLLTLLIDTAILQYSGYIIGILMLYVLYKDITR